MKHPSDLVAAAKVIIAKVPYITIASVSPDGLPWNTPVFTAYDDTYTFYFSTDTASHKAVNIQHNENVFLVIYDSTAPIGTGIGVYIEGTARLLTEEQQKRHAYDTLVGRRSPASFHTFEEYTVGPYGLYAVYPTHVYMNTQSERLGYYVDKKVEIDLLAASDKTK